MINLLPPEKHKQLHAAQQNSLLIRYVFASLVTLFLIIAIHVGTFALLKTTEMSGKKASEENQLKVSRYKKTEQAAKEYAANLATAKDIFSKQVPYSDAIINLASQLPSGVVLDTISLDAEVVNKPTTLAARAKSYEAALALKDMFNASTLAKDVSITSVNTSGNEGVGAAGLGGVAAPENADYPVSVVLNITFTDELLRPGEKE
jgi:Tfp pilus assembly protein PilN